MTPIEDFREGLEHSDRIFILFDETARPYPRPFRANLIGLIEAWDPSWRLIVRQLDGCDFLRLALFAAIEKRETQYGTTAMNEMIVSTLIATQAEYVVFCATTARPIRPEGVPTGFGVYWCYMV
jgi:hypothetical protein